MFMDDHLFQTFEKDINKALTFFEQMNESSGKRSMKDDLLDVKKKVYKACRSLADQRRSRYLDDHGNWKSIEQEIIDKEKVYSGLNPHCSLFMRSRLKTPGTGTLLSAELARSGSLRDLLRIMTR